MPFPTLATVITLIEGPYKWYVIALVIVVLTALFTRFVFKTIKWFLLLAMFAALASALYFLLR